MHQGKIGTGSCFELHAKQHRYQTGDNPQTTTAFVSSLQMWPTHISHIELVTLIYRGFVERAVPHSVPLVTWEKMSCSWYDWYEHQILLKLDAEQY